MSVIKREVINGSINGKNSTFTVEILERNNGFEVTYSDNKGWGIGYKTYKKCDSISEASTAYSDLLHLIQI